MLTNKNLMSIMTLRGWTIFIRHIIMSLITYLGSADRQSYVKSSLIFKTYEFQNNLIYLLFIN